MSARYHAVSSRRLLALAWPCRASCIGPGVGSWRTCRRSRSAPTKQQHGNNLAELARACSATCAAASSAAHRSRSTSARAGSASSESTVARLPRHRRAATTRRRSNRSKRRRWRRARTALAPSYRIGSRCTCAAARGRPPHAPRCHRAPCAVACSPPPRCWATAGCARRTEAGRRLPAPRAPPGPSHPRRASPGWPRPQAWAPRRRRASPRGRRPRAAQPAATSAAAAG